MGHLRIELLDWFLHCGHFLFSRFTLAHGIKFRLWFKSVQQLIYPDTSSLFVIEGTRFLELILRYWLLVLNLIKIVLFSARIKNLNEVLSSFHDLWCITKAVPRWQKIRILKKLRIIQALTGLAVGVTSQTGIDGHWHLGMTILLSLFVRSLFLNYRKGLLTFVIGLLSFYIFKFDV